LISNLIVDSSQDSQFTPGFTSLQVNISNSFNYTSTLNSGSISYITLGSGTEINLLNESVSYWGNSVHNIKFYGSAYNNKINNYGIINIISTYPNLVSIMSEQVIYNQYGRGILQGDLNTFVVTGTPNYYSGQLIHTNISSPYNILPSSTTNLILYASLTIKTKSNILLIDPSTVGGSTAIVTYQGANLGAAITLWQKSVCFVKYIYIRYIYILYVCESSLFMNFTSTTTGRCLLGM